MTVDELWIDRLAHLAIACRPHGARQWDTPGTKAAIRKVQHLALPDVAAACIRAGADRTLHTPAAIGDTRSSAWRERITDDTQVPTARGPWCKSCGQPEPAPIHTDGACTYATRPPKTTDDVTTTVTNLKAAIQPTRTYAKADPQ